MRRSTTSFRADRPTVAELAAGALVQPLGAPEVLLLHHAAEERWCFPKGHVDAGESASQAAVREVLEESGLSIDLGRELTSVTYRFYDPARDLSVVKTTIYFLATAPARELVLEPTFDAGRWANLNEAKHLVGFDSERAVLDHLRVKH